jgi:hypothetical protein
MVSPTPQKGHAPDPGRRPRASLVASPLAARAVEAHSGVDALTEVAIFDRATDLSLARFGINDGANRREL